RLLRNRRGATAVEFALVAMPLLALIVAALQVAVVFFFDQALQTVTAEAGRMLMVGTAQKAGLTQAQFTTAVCATAPSAFTCSKLMIDVESFSTFSSASTSPLTPTYSATGAVTNTWSYSPGDPGSIVVIRLMYPWPVISGPLSFGLANQPNGTHLLVGTAVVKNEPYQ
ncbi:MAG: TadE/TadG family type IV pilus assembly protein, partial [Caulobacteraceae bacterium]